MIFSYSVWYARNAKKMYIYIYIHAIIILPIVLLFNYLENEPKSNYTLYCIGINFSFTFPPSIGRIKICGLTYFFYPSLFPSFFFSSLSNNPNILYSKIHPKFLFPSTFLLYQRNSKRERIDGDWSSECEARESGG